MGRCDKDRKIFLLPVISLIPGSLMEWLKAGIIENDESDENPSEMILN